MCPQSQRLRQMVDDDNEAVLALNAASEQVVSPLDRRQLAWLRARAQRAEVVAVDGAVAAFVIVLPADTTYDSPNYRWFQERYGDRFLYLDRIVVADGYRRTGIGKLIYDAVEDDAHHQERVALEVNVEPPNESSLAFHANRGYREVGRLRLDSGKVNAMLVKELAP